MANERTDAPPSGFPDVTPPRYPMTDYSFTLQAVMELQKTIGGLTEAVNTLKTQTERQGTKLDSISHRVYAATVIVMIAVPIVAFLANWFAPSIVAALHLPSTK
jgi:hypothetical protein